MARRRVLTVLLSLLVFAAALAAPAPLVQAQENRRAAAFGIEVRQGRRAAPGIEVRLRLEGSSLAPTSSATPPPQTTDERGRAEFWWLTPGIWQVDLLIDGEVAYFLTVRIEAGRRAQEMGAPARDADAPDMRWKFFRPSGPPPTPAPAPRAAEEPPPPPPPVREPVDETPPPPPRAERPAPEPEPERAEPMEEPAEPEPMAEEPMAEEPPAEEPMAEPETSAPEMPQPAAEPAMPEPEPEPEPEMPEPEPEPEMAEPEPQMPPPVAEAEAEEPEFPAAAGEGEVADAPLPPGRMPDEDDAEDAEPEQGAIERERPEALTQVPPAAEPPPVEMSEPEEVPPPPKPQPIQPQTLEQPFEEAAPEADEAMPEPEPEPSPEMTPQPVPRPSATPPPPPPAEPAAAAAPRFSVRSGAEGDCEECRAPETAVRVERTVPAGDGTCASGSAAAARRLADRLASRGEGLGAGMPLDGQEVASYISGGASCQLFGVVLPPGVRYRGYTFSVADGAGGGGACFAGKQCPIAGALWPNRPTIEELPNGARVVWALFQNASGAALRASLTAYYVAAE